MKKLLAVCAVLPLTLSLLLLGGCVLYGNDRSRVGTMGVYEEGDTVYFSLPMESFYFGGGEVKLAFDRAENTLTLAEHKAECEPVSGCVLWGDTFRGVLEAAEGYEQLAEKVKALDSREYKYITAFATKTSDMVYGFCVIYKKPTGFLSGGGQIDAREITKSILFSYDREEGELNILSTLEDRIVVAFDGENAVYYYKEKYYLGDLSGEKEQYLCDDPASDKELALHSHATFFESGGWCVLYFRLRVDNIGESFDRYVVTDMGGTFYAELKLSHDPTW